MTEYVTELTLAWQLLGQDRPIEAEQRAAAVLAREPDNVSAIACHALATWRSGAPVQLSITELERAVALEPGNGALRHNLATVLSSKGDIAGAMAQSRRALEIDPSDAEAFYGLALSTKFREEDDLVRGMVDRYEGNNSVTGVGRELLGFALAKVFDDLNQPARAFRYAAEANAMVHRPFDLKSEQAQLDELRRMTEADSFRKLGGSSQEADTLLFIVGMTRSGTTLVESILSRHPSVLAQGELGQISMAERALRRRLGVSGEKLGRNGMLPTLRREWLKVASEGLLQETAARARVPFKIATDKQPDNALRLGLVSLLFPKARVIHVRRHPLDTGLSNFMKRFSNGQGFSFRLDWIGAKTRLVADSMVLWKRALDLPILDVRYEELVADPAAQSRRLVEFAGLEWTDACLAPENTQRSVLTASQWQVRQPIYRGAVGRWRDYEAYLAPMIGAMGGMGWIDTEAGPKSTE
ncbi:MAG TPA: sulfotransferase [Devosia sp.]|nr:sulfotransferase [Devosia sp.]